MGCSLGLGYEEVTEEGLEMRLLFCKVFSAEVVRFFNFNTQISKQSIQYPYVDSLDSQTPFHGCRGAGFETSRQANCFYKVITLALTCSNVASSRPFLLNSASTARRNILSWKEAHRTAITLAEENISWMATLMWDIATCPSPLLVSSTCASSVARRQMSSARLASPDTAAT